MPALLTQTRSRRTRAHWSENTVTCCGAAPPPAAVHASLWPVTWSASTRRLPSTVTSRQQSSATSRSTSAPCASAPPCTFSATTCQSGPSAGFQSHVNAGTQPASTCSRLLPSGGASTLQSASMSRALRMRSRKLPCGVWCTFADPGMCARLALLVTYRRSLNTTNVRNAAASVSESCAEPGCSRKSARFCIVHSMRPACTLRVAACSAGV